MGQQQLLLLVLGIVIVGLAVVAGIQAFGENAKKSNADAMVNDAVRIASDAQAWYMKPQAFGGGNGSFTGLDFAKLGYTFTAGDPDENDDPDVYTSVNGEYTITVGGSGTSLLIEGESDENVVNVRVCGTTPNSIKTGVNVEAPAC